MDQDETVRYLIDGFNLLHVAIGRHLGPADETFTEDDVDRFLRTLSELLGEERCAKTTIVFDARHRPLWEPRTSQRYGLHVINAVDSPDADTLIVDLIEQDSGPRDLTVVSSDRVIIDAARRRKAHHKRSEEFLKELYQWRRCRAESAADDNEKPTELTPAQVAYWIRVFTRDRPRTDRISSPTQQVRPRARRAGP